MESEKPSMATLAEKAEKLMLAAQSGNTEEAYALFEKLSAMHDHSLYQDLGHLTREFHDSLNEYERAHYTENMGDKDLPDAGDRLHHVIHLTQDAAHKTLKATEKSSDKIKEILKVCNTMADKAYEAIENSEDAALVGKAKQVIIEKQSELQSQINDVQSALTEVVMAQEYQDLSGQILRKVITLVTGLHLSLVALLGEAAQVQKEEISDHKEAPLTSQEDVDDLLASLGF